MKKIIATLLMIWFPFSALAVDTYSIDLENSSTENQYLNLADASQTGLEAWSDFTVECWYKPEELPAGDPAYLGGKGHALMSKYASTGNNRSFMWVYGKTAATPTYSFEAILSTSGTTITYGKVDSTLTAGTWYFVAGVRDATAGTFDVWLGTSASAPSKIGTISSLSTGALYNGTAAFQIGANSNQNQYTDGKFDDCRVFSDKRTDAEIATDYCPEAITTSEGGLVSWWKFEDSGSPSLDETANNNDLTWTNSPVGRAADVPTEPSGCGAPPATTAPDDGFIFFMYAPLPDRFVV